MVTQICGIYKKEMKNKFIVNIYVEDEFEKRLVMVINNRIMKKWLLNSEHMKNM
jgi:hypothetical protein